MVKCELLIDQRFLIDHKWSVLRLLRMVAFSDIFLALFAIFVIYECAAASQNGP